MIFAEGAKMKTEAIDRHAEGLTIPVFLEGISDLHLFFQKSWKTPFPFQKCLNLKRIMHYYLCFINALLRCTIKIMRHVSTIWNNHTLATDGTMSAFMHRMLLLFVQKRLNTYARNYLHRLMHHRRGFGDWWRLWPTSSRFSASLMGFGARRFHILFRPPSYHRLLLRFIRELSNQRTR